MSTKALIKIYHESKDPGSLGGVEQLLQIARQLHVPAVTRKPVQEFLKSEQAYTLHKPARRRFIRNQSYVAGIDAQLQADLADMQGIAMQTSECGTFLKCFIYFPNSPGRCQSTLKTPRQLRRLSGKCLQLRTHATLSVYRPIRARNYSTRTSRP